MKNVSKAVAFITILISTAVLSCKENEMISYGSEKIVLNTNNLIVSELKGSRYSQQLKDIYSNEKNIIETNIKLMNVGILLSTEDFNFDIVYRSKNKESRTEAFTILSRTHPNLAFVVFETDGHLANSMLIRTENSDLGMNAEYINYSELTLLNIRQKNGNIEFNSQAYGNQIPRNSKVSGCGQATMDCITDAYSNHGWNSVFAWVSTAFVPYVAAGIAALCTERNCGH
jgi:hypothetical protein